MTSTYLTSVGKRQAKMKETEAHVTDLKIFKDFVVRK